MAIFKIHEQLEKNNGVALKASNKNKEKKASSSSKVTNKDDSDDSSDSESMNEEEMALFMRKFKKVMKKSGFFDKNKDKSKTKRKSQRLCFGCGKKGHFIADYPKAKHKKEGSSKFDKSKYKKKNIGEAHLGQEWDSNEESSNSDKEVGLATMAIGVSTPKSSLFEDLTDNEDDFTHTCLMARGLNVDSDSPFHNNDDVNSDDEKMIKGLEKHASKRIMKLMIELEDRDETLEVQEELFRLEREKTIALENSFKNEKKGFKMQENLLKAKMEKVVSLEKYLSKEKMKVEELTKKLSLAKDASANLKIARLSSKRTSQSAVQEIFKKFATRTQNEFEVKIKRVRSDNSTKFKNTNIEEYLDKEGIGQEFSVPTTK
ncbi:uncharacterized protein LOC101782529 [Setaria italica]|uniref:uncharacterized protein LOC101782529 n=1 Tax=Setaria italica TaxID=4555 RepID=UPI0003511EE4|nr:uncharacterized protein LOC101782529 [Setaria italica]